MNDSYSFLESDFNLDENGIPNEIALRAFVSGAISPGWKLMVALASAEPEVERKLDQYRQEWKKFNQDQGCLQITRTLVEVKRLGKASNIDVMYVSSISWDPEKEIKVPLEMLPAEHRNVKIGQCFFAEVGTDTEIEGNLFFLNFEPTPYPASENIFG